MLKYTCLPEFKVFKMLQCMLLGFSFLNSFVFSFLIFCDVVKAFEGCDSYVNLIYLLFVFINFKVYHILDIISHY